jgi:hypothetical protein
MFPLPAYFKYTLSHSYSHSVHTNVGSDIHVITCIKIERFWLVTICKRRMEGNAAERTKLLVPINGTSCRGLRIAKVIIPYVRVNAAGVAQSA